MKVVGLTGGIGSGKTTVAKLFIELGVPIYFADDHAKRLMNSSKTIKSKLINEFGAAAFLDGRLNRAYLAKIVFNDTAKLAAINAIVHPSVQNSFKRWVSKQNANYIIQENAILFESGMHKNFDTIISVVAPLEERVSRVMQRDNVNRKAVLSRIKNQLSDEVKIARSNYIIHNVNLENTKKQVLKIHNKLLK